MMSEPTVFVGLDVGKSDHHCTALNVAGDRLVDRPVRNDEAALRQLFGGLAVHGELVVVVDQPGLAPVTRRSGSSIKGEHPARGGNKRLKNALFLSAFAAPRRP